MNMSDNKTNTLVGHNYTTPDLVAKVTGKAKYAEDYRVDGMLFSSLLPTPMPNPPGSRPARSRRLASPGVKRIPKQNEWRGVPAGTPSGGNAKTPPRPE